MSFLRDAQHLTFDQAQSDILTLDEEWASVGLVQIGGWTRGTPWFVAVDAHRAPALADIRWRQFRGSDFLWYAAHPVTDRFLHRLLMRSPEGFIDHVNGNTLDNRRINLRVATSRQSAQNRGKASECSSRFKGVYRDRRGYWVAEIVVDGRRLYLGRFLDEENAAWVYDEAATTHFGQYARINHVPRPASDRTPRKPRYSAETQAEALRLAEDIGASAAARRLDVTVGALNYWRRRRQVSDADL